MSKYGCIHNREIPCSHPEKCKIKGNKNLCGVQKSIKNVSEMSFPKDLIYAAFVQGDGVAFAFLVLFIWILIGLFILINGIFMR